MPQELTKLLSKRYYNSFHFRPETQQMKTRWHYGITVNVNHMAYVSFLVSNRPQVTGAQFGCQFTKPAHYNYLLNMTT